MKTWQTAGGLGWSGSHVGISCPDKLADILRSDDSDFKTLEIIQRIMLRAYARYTDVAITGTRGMTKTYTKMISEMMNGAAGHLFQVLYLPHQLPGLYVGVCQHGIHAVVLDPVVLLVVLHALVHVRA